MRTRPAFFGDQAGTTAVEFALVLPLALLLLFGIIDTGRYAWTLNQVEKATQMGVRYAVATKIVPQGLNEADYVGTDCGGTALTAGDTICSDALGTISCDKTACTCAVAPCPALGTYNTDAFDAIVSRIRVFAPRVSEDHVIVSYSGSGIGFAGDPAADDDGDPLTDIAPIVTVRIDDLNYAPITLSLLGGTIGLPDFRYSLTLEDGEGAIAS